MRSQKSSVGVVHFRVEANELDSLKGMVTIESGADFTQRNRASRFDGVAKGATTDGGECDGAELVLVGELKRALVARREKLRFVMLAAAPGGADGVDDEFRRQVVAYGDFGIARGAAAEGAAFFEKFWAGGIVNCAVNASAAQQRGVGSVDDGVDVEFGNITTEKLDGVGHGAMMVDRAQGNKGSCSIRPPQKQKRPILADRPFVFDG